MLCIPEVFVRLSDYKLLCPCASLACITLQLFHPHVVHAGTQRRSKALGEFLLASAHQLEQEQKQGQQEFSWVEQDKLRYASAVCTSLSSRMRPQYPSP